MVRKEKKEISLFWRKNYCAKWKKIWNLLSLFSSKAKPRRNQTADTLHLERSLHWASASHQQGHTGQLLASPVVLAWQQEDKSCQGPHRELPLRLPEHAAGSRAGPVVTTVLTGRALPRCDTQGYLGQPTAKTPSRCYMPLLWKCRSFQDLTSHKSADFKLRLVPSDSTVSATKRDLVLAIKRSGFI